MRTTDVSTAASNLLARVPDSGKGSMPDSLERLLKDSQGADSKREVKDIFSRLGNDKDAEKWLETRLGKLTRDDVDVTGKLDRPSEFRALAKYIRETVADLPRARRDEAGDLLAFADWLDAMADKAEAVGFSGLARKSDFAINDLVAQPGGFMLRSS